MDYSGSTWVAQSALPRMGAPPDVVREKILAFCRGRSFRCHGRCLHDSGRHDREGDDQMTPEERNLIIDLFDRLATLEDAQRDPDAERLIRDGLRQAPNAPYALVQTVLVQDEALKRADARIRELEGATPAETPPRDTSFLGGVRESGFGKREA